MRKDLEVGEINSVVRAHFVRTLRPGFSSQLPHGSQLKITPVPGDVGPPSNIHRYQAFPLCQNVHEKPTCTYKINL